MWYKGYTHYHTGFRFPLKYRVSPKKLIEGMRKVGASFVFCAGTHGDAIEGDKKYWGMELTYNTYPAYRAYFKTQLLLMFFLLAHLKHIFVFVHFRDLIRNIHTRIQGMSITAVSIEVVSYQK